MDIHEEEHYFDFARDIGLKGYELFALPYFAHKLMKSLPPKKQLTQPEIADGISTALRYMTSKALDGTSDYVTRKQFPILKEQLDNLETEVGMTQKRVDEIKQSASRRAKRICFVGSSVVLGQFALIFYGTFHYLSWDIMEPICYLMTFTNFFGGWAFYLLQKRDLDLTNFHDILTLRFTQKACRREGIDMDKLEEQKEQIRKLRQALRVVTY